MSPHDNFRSFLRRACSSLGERLRDAPVSIKLGDISIPWESISSRGRSDLLEEAVYLILKYLILEEYRENASIRHVNARGYDIEIRMEEKFYVNVKAEKYNGNQLPTFWLMSRSSFDRMGDKRERLYVLHLEYDATGNYIRARKISLAGPVSEMDVIVYNKAKQVKYILTRDRRQEPVPEHLRVREDFNGEHVHLIRQDLEICWERC